MQRPDQAMSYKAMQHPLEILPEGNLLINKQQNSRDHGGLGLLCVLPDPQLADILEYLEAQSLCQLMQTSKSFYAFCVFEDYWMQFVIAQFNGVFSYRSSWRQTYLDCISSFKSPIGKPISCKGLYSDMLFQRWHRIQLDFRKSWISQESIPRIDISELSVERFRRDFVLSSRPVIISGLCSHWPAINKWNRQYLSDVSKGHLFEAGAIKTTLDNFFIYADQNKDEAPAFIFDPKFADNVPELKSDYTVPHLFEDDLFQYIPDRPNFRWVLLGNRFSGSKWHIDPNRTHAWNGVIKGAKRWIFFPPGYSPPGVFPSPEGGEVTQPLLLMDWYINYYEAAKNGAGGAQMLEGTCRVGELMFIPKEWWHAVVNLEDDTFAITQNCVTPDICSDVRWFLRYRSDQVSGVSDVRKFTLWNQFDEILKEYRPELLGPLPPPPIKDTRDSINSESRFSNYKKKRKLDNTTSKETSSTQNDSIQLSFWDTWKQTNKKLVINWTAAN